MPALVLRLCRILHLWPCHRMGAYVAVAGVLTMLILPAASEAAWQIVPSPADGELNSVSCTSPSACTAVGFVGTVPAGGGTVLAQRWNGATWSLQPISPPFGGQSEWSEVSCGSPRFCVALGMLVHARTLTGGAQSIRGMWNGSTWSVQVLPKSSFANAVSCLSARFCLMTGSRTERWNGSRWLTMPIKGGLAYGTISCTSARSCVEISYLTALRWDGSRWSPMGTVPTEVDLSQGSASVSAVSCASQLLCIAVGRESVGGDYPDTPIVARWNGRRWLRQPAAERPDATVTAVSCVRQGCTVAGERSPYVPGGLPQSITFAESWAPHGRWVIQATPNPSTWSNDLAGVSCLVSRCVAVGSFTTPTQAQTTQGQTLVEQRG